MFVFQLFTMTNAVFLVLNLTCFNLSTMSALFDIQYPYFLVYIYRFIRIFSFFYTLFLAIQSCLIRYWIEFVWKSVRAIDDRMIMVFIHVNTAFQSMIFAFMFVWNAGGLQASWWITTTHPLLMTTVHKDLR